MLPPTSWECPRCYLQNSGGSMRCPRCNCLNPNAGIASVRREIATSTGSPVPLAVLCFVVAVLLLITAGGFALSSFFGFSLASSNHAVAVQYLSDCSAATVAKGTADVLAASNTTHYQDYLNYLDQHSSDPCQFQVTTGQIYQQKMTLGESRPLGYYFDSQSATDANFNIRLAPSPAPDTSRAITPAVVEQWQRHQKTYTFHEIPSLAHPVGEDVDRDVGQFTAVSGNGARYLAWDNPIVAEEDAAASGRLDMIVALLVAVCAVGMFLLGRARLNRRPQW